MYSILLSCLRFIISFNIWDRKKLFLLFWSISRFFFAQKCIFLNCLFLFYIILTFASLTNDFKHDSYGNNFIRSELITDKKNINYLCFCSFPQRFYSFGSWFGSRILWFSGRLCNWYCGWCRCTWYRSTATSIRRNDSYPYFRWSIRSLWTNCCNLFVYKINICRLSFIKTYNMFVIIVFGGWFNRSVPNPSHQKVSLVSFHSIINLINIWSSHMLVKPIHVYFAPSL